MQILITVILRLLVALLIIGSALPIFETGKAAGNGGAIIADHTVVDQYDKIPQQWINEVKKMYLNVPGESHSGGYRIGIKLLSQFNPNYPSLVIDTGPPSPYREDALRLDRWVYNDTDRHTGEGVWFTWHAWDPADPDYPTANATMIKNHLDYCDNISSNIKIAAIGFGWCWDMSYRNPPGGGIDPVYNVRWAGASEGGPDGREFEYGLRWGLDDDDYALTGNRVNMDDYLQATEEYISYVQSKGYNTKVFFTTGPVDRGTDYNAESGYQREIKQQYIRDYVISHGKVLFDYADILTHNATGHLFTGLWNGHTFPQIHPDNQMDYDENWNMIPGDPNDGDHIGEVGALRLAKAMWWLLARLAGWNGTPATFISITITDSPTAGIHFGSLTPGATNAPDTDSSNVTPSIIVNVAPESTVSVDLQLKGTAFGTGFAVTNAKYCTTYDGTKVAMSTTYATFASNVPHDGTGAANVWHWLDVPSSGVTAGAYSSAFSYKAVPH